MSEVDRMGETVRKIQEWIQTVADACDIAQLEYTSIAFAKDEIVVTVPAPARAQEVATRQMGDIAVLVRFTEGP